MYAASVLADVPADGAARLTRRVWHVVEAVRRCGARDLRVDDARLNQRETVLRVNLQNAAHARKLYAHAAADGQSAARKTRPRAARHKRHALAREKLQDFGDLFRRSWEDDGARPVSVVRQPVALVHEQLFSVRDDLFWP